jgi:hypothetical protein
MHTHSIARSTRSEVRSSLETMGITALVVDDVEGMEP